MDQTNKQTFGVFIALAHDKTDEISSSVDGCVLPCNLVPKSKTMPKTTTSCVVEARDWKNSSRS